jgi:hypothetical protein
MHLRIKAVALLITGASVIGLIAPQFAGAANSTYPPKGQARSFHTGDGGWQGSTSFGGLCIPAVNCPTVTNEFVASGGSGGSSDGYLRTRIGSLLGVGATSRGIYESPSFKYRGVHGNQPDKLTLSLARRSTLGTLLAVAGNSANYSVDLVDTSQGGSATTVIDGKAIGDQNSWRASSVSVPSGSLTLGDRYKVRITSEFVTGVQVVPGGGVGFDDVVLKAKSHGSGGSGGGRHLRHQLGNGIGPAIQKGKHLSVRVKCPGSVRPNKCRMSVAALLKKHGPKVTNAKQARIGAGKKRHLRLRVKHAYSKKVAHRKRILVLEKVKVGHRNLTVVKSVRVVRH